MIVPLFTKLDRMLTLFVFVLFQVMCRCTCGHVTFSGGIRNLIVFGDIFFKIQCTRLVLIGYKNVTGDIQKYVKIIMKNGFCNVKFCFGIALSKTGRPSSTLDEGLNALSGKNPSGCWLVQPTNQMSDISAYAH